MRTDRLHLIGERSRAFLFPRAQFLLHLETHNERILFVFFRGRRTRTLSFFLSFFLSSVVEKESVYKREKRIKKRIPTRTSLSLSLFLSPVFLLLRLE